MEQNSVSFYRLVAIMFLVGVALVTACSGQATVWTGRMDNQRTGANTSETLLTPQNVNKNDFGFLFNYPIDYMALGQPLFIPNVNINGQGVLYNVVYVGTMADSVYAFDANHNTTSPLWSVNFTNPAIYGPGITTASGADLPCSGGKTSGFSQEGIAGTPVIDTNTGTMYVVAKTVENGTVVLRLHALDITNGSEKFGGPVPISASVNYQGTVATFTALHQFNRPGLLLQNGIVYLAFGSNGCDDGNGTGWVLSYNASNLSPIASFNDSPISGSASIWQTGNAIAADENGNIFVETAEVCPTCFTPGGPTYPNSVVELDPNTLTVTDYFTPFDVVFLNSWDEDLSSTGVLILPDLDGLTPHELVAGGKEGFVFVLDRDALGGFNSSCGNPSPACDNTLQEFPVIPGEQSEQVRGVLFSSPAFWNNTVYFAPNASPLLAYPLSSGSVPLGTPVQTVQKHPGAHSPSISANGNTNGLLWAISGGNLYAFDAVTMRQLYVSTQVKSRDDLPPVAHFATQTVANGKVYIATETTLQAYGLFQYLTLSGGGNQSAPVLTALPAPIQLQVIDPYNAVGIPNVTVTFSDGGKGGVFNPPNSVSDAYGNVSTTYTLGKVAGAYTITASSADANLTFAETALPGTATKVIATKGNQQTGQAGSILPTQLRVTIEDAYNNGVAGVTATFVDQSGAGTLSPSTAVSNASGYAMVSYQLPNTAGKYKIVVSVAGLKATNFTEHAAGDSPANVAVVSGNNQTAAVNTALSQPLVVQVTDQGANPVAGVSVAFSAPSGTFSGAPATTDSNGMATVNYTTGNSSGAVTITASVNAVKTPITVNVTAGAPAAVTITGGNNQIGTAGTTLPQPLSVLVADQYGNPVSGVSVYYGDGGSGGIFDSGNPVVTGSSGIANQYYTLPLSPGTFNISASASGVSSPAVFTESGQ